MLLINVWKSRVRRSSTGCFQRFALYCCNLVQQWRTCLHAGVG